MPVKVALNKVATPPRRHMAQMPHAGKPGRWCPAWIGRDRGRVTGENWSSLRCSRR